MTDRSLTYDVVLAGSGTLNAPDGVRALPVTGPDAMHWSASAAQQLPAPAHVIAAADDVPGALALAAEHPDRVASLIVVDPVIDTQSAEVLELMDRIGVPTLVIAAAPTPASSIEHGQCVAGGVDNGVFVIIDGAAAPTLASRPASVLEWSHAFMVIAEGLAATRLDLATAELC